MSTLSAAAQPTAPTVRGMALGRPFVSPLFDLLVIGGGLSLIVGATAWASGFRLSQAHVPAILLFGNFAHFAASTVRLYATPDAVHRWPFLTVGFPVACLVAFTAILTFVPGLVPYVFAVFLVWSPYHYAAQTYGLASMYAYRSDCRLDDDDKRLLRAACLLPFVWALLRPQGGIGVVLRHLGIAGPPVLETLRFGAGAAVSTLALAAPLAVVALLWRRGRSLPLISLGLVVVNAIWWTAFNYINAFFWAALFHGVQYLAIASIFHVRERTRRPGNRHGPLVHAGTFYGASVALAYVLFVAWPDAYVALGYDARLTPQLVVAVINIHHFVVDAYVWRLRRDPNYRTVVDGAVPAGA
ncbi:MAG: hypothetical protein E6K82_09170 [Candidatus Rokuibacteriota bacterium]|nr:MAG: hypothetical protein E6K82_09170 [Candidatus Rokubacteria bacterium]